MSETPHVTDVEVARALNALVTTLNDQRPAALDGDRAQAIVTGALGGEPRITVQRVGAENARLTDAVAGDRRVLASIRREGARWLGTREGAPLSGGYVPR